MSAQSTATATLTEAEQERLTAFFDEGAAKVSPQDPYWIRYADRDDSDDYCWACGDIEVVKAVARFRRLPRAKKSRSERPRLCGGYSSEGDSTPFCEGCGALLGGSLTNEGCAAELEHFLGYGCDITSDDDRRALSGVIAARGWAAWSGRVYQRDYERQRDEEYFTDLHALCRQILDQIDGVKGGAR